ncbi:MAG: Os1348 family NHLP clan protein [Thermoanaerobaculia bacterium]
MSQRTVEQVIGRLVTDEGFRRRFADDPRAAIEEVVCWGCELNSCEWQALLRIDPRSVEQLADSIDPGLLKADLSGGVS